MFLRRNLTYIIAEGELELSSQIPNINGKIETMEVLCKKKPGDIFNKVEAQKDVIRKVRIVYF